MALSQQARPIVMRRNFPDKEDLQSTHPASVLWQVPSRGFPLSCSPGFQCISLIPQSAFVVNKQLWGQQCCCQNESQADVQPLFNQGSTIFLVDFGTVFSNRNGWQHFPGIKRPGFLGGAEAAAGLGVSGALPVELVGDTTATRSDELEFLAEAFFFLMEA